jgi:hypothetical protein
MTESPLPGIETLKTMHQQAYVAKPAPDHIADIQAQLASQRKRYEASKFRSLSPSQGLLHELRHEFARSLNKLVSLDTRDVAVRELRLIIERNVSLEALKVLLSCLGEHRKNRASAAREQEVLLIGFIAQVYETRLQDELKTLVRMAELVHEYFKDLNRKVHEAAATSLSQIYAYALSKEDLEEVMSFMFDPLFNIMTTGVDVKSQYGAAVALFKWTEHLASQEEGVVLTVLQSRVLTLFMKLRPEFADLVSTLGVLVDSCGFQFVVSELYGVLAKLLLYVKAQGQFAVNLKIEACKLLTVIGKHLQGMADIVLGRCHDEVIRGLVDARTDRQPSVQVVARDALKEWERLRDIQRDVEEQKTQQEEIDPEELIRLKTEYAEMARYRPQAVEGMELSPSQKAPITSNFKALREMVKRRKSGAELEGNPKIAKELGQIEDIRGQWRQSKPSYLAPIYAEGRRPQSAAVRLSSSGELNFSKRLPHKDVLAVIERRTREAERPKQSEEPTVKAGLPPRHRLEVASSTGVSIERFDEDYRGRHFAEQEIEVSEVKSAADLQPSSKSLYSRPVSAAVGPPKDPRSLYGDRPEVMPRLQVSKWDEDDEGTPMPSEENIVRYKHVFPTAQNTAQDLYRAPIVMQSVDSVNLNPLEEQSEELDARPIRGVKPPQAEFLLSVKSDLVKTISEGLQGNLQAMQGRLESNFNAIEYQLQRLDGRLSDAHERIEELKDAPPVDKLTQSKPPQARSGVIQPRPVQVHSGDQTVPVVRSQAAQADSGRVPTLKARQESAAKLLQRSDRSGRDIDSLTLMWLKVLEHLHQDELASAYKLVLESGDDLYLLRLMLKTGVVLEELPKDLGIELMKRLGSVLNSLFLENIGMEWMEDSYHIGLFDRLGSDDRQLLVEPLHRMRMLDCEEGRSAAKMLRQFKS